MNRHDRYESLAGALALGEAKSEERAEFAAHAATCRPCRADAEFSPAFAAAVVRARDAERWRPARGIAILARIREIGDRRSRTTLGVLGWAVALSIVLDLAFVSGFAAQVATVMRPGGAPRSTVALRTATLEARGATSFAERSFERSATVAARTQRSVVFTHLRRSARSARAQPNPMPRPVVAMPPVTPAADVLAGLDFDRPDRASRGVAVAATPPCDSAVSDIALPAAGQYDGSISDGRKTDGSRSDGTAADGGISDGAVSGVAPAREIDPCPRAAPGAAYSESEAAPFKGSSSRN